MTAPWIRHLGRSVQNNSPAILSGFAVAGVLTTAYLAAKAAVAASEKNKDTIQFQELPPITARDQVEAHWKLFIPAGLSGAATIACVIGANQIGMRRNAALLAAATLADTAFRDYKDEVIKQIGANKEKKVVDQVAIDKMDAEPPKDGQVIITGGGDQLCFDSITGRYFRSDIERIRRAVNDINQNIVNDMYASLNEFYDLLGLGSTTIGDELGWNIERMLEIEFTSHISLDGTPCLAISYKRLPFADYGKVF